MKPGEQDVPRLSAYVDGELEPAEAAGVAADIAGDRDTARAVAGLTALKAGVRDAFDAGGGGIPGIRPGPRRTGIAAAGIVAACLTGLGGAWWTYDTDSRSGVLAGAVAHYDGWLDTGVIRTASAPGSIIVPDLTQAGLTARTIEPAVRLGAVTASHVTYLGRRGCRLSLYAYQAEGAGHALPPPAEAGVLADRWTVRGLDYLLVARRMNAERFRMLAGAMRKATRDAAPPDAATRIAIGRARQPCRA